MTGYFLADACVAALNEVIGMWAGLPPITYVAELLDASDVVVTAQNFQLVQDCGWIGWGARLKFEQKQECRPFYVIPWLTPPTPIRTCRKWQGGWYDDRGNYLGRVRGKEKQDSPEAVVEAAPFRCEFKVLEDELKKVSSIRIRVGE